MQSEHRLSSAIFPSREVAERAAHELRRIGLANVRLSEARPTDIAPTFGTFVRELVERVRPKRAEPLVDGTAPLGSFLDRLVGLGVPAETAAVIRTQLEAGATLVTVRSGGHSERAMEIMRSFYDPTAAARQPHAPAANAAEPPARADSAIDAPVERLPEVASAPQAPIAPPPIAAQPTVAPQPPSAPPPTVAHRSLAEPEPEPPAAPEPPPAREIVAPAPARQNDTRSLSPAETAELVAGAGAESAMLARLQAMGGLTVRKVTVVEQRRVDVELRREELVIAREVDGAGTSASEIRIPLSHEELAIEKRVVLAQWQQVDFGALDATRT